MHFSAAHPRTHFKKRIKGKFEREARSKPLPVVLPHRAFRPAAGFASQCSCRMTFKIHRKALRRCIFLSDKLSVCCDDQLPFFLCHKAVEFMDQGALPRAVHMQIWLINQLHTLPSNTIPKRRFSSLCCTLAYLCYTPSSRDQHEG